jgi:hypothetical protein
VDGGRTWVEVQPGKPPGTPTPKGPEPGLHEPVWGAYYTTLIAPNGHGILGMVEMPDKAEAEGRAATPAVVLRTVDHGRSWHRTARLELPHVSGVFDASYVFARQGHGREYQGRTLRFWLGMPQDFTVLSFPLPFPWRPLLCVGAPSVNQPRSNRRPPGGLGA